jgi:hypothetical protein
MANFIETFFSREFPSKNVALQALVNDGRVLKKVTVNFFIRNGRFNVLLDTSTFFRNIDIYDNLRPGGIE